VENKERWMELCAQAAKEQDPERLFKLVQEINILLEEKETRLKGQKAENYQEQKEQKGRANLKQPAQPIH